MSYLRSAVPCSVVLAVTVSLAAGACASTNAAPKAASPPVPTSGSTDLPTAQPTQSDEASSVPIKHGPRRGNTIALTFDADFSPAALRSVRTGRIPEQVNVPVIDYLERNGVPATVFVTGMWAKRYPGEFSRLAGNPRLQIENHTWNHDAWTADCYHLPYVSTDQEKRNQLWRTDAVLQNASGRRVAYFRFPGLCHTHHDVKLVAAQGLISVDTDVPVSDAFARNPDKTTDAMLSAIKPGSIVVMHLNGAPNAPVTDRILESLVPALKARGLELVTLSQLLGPSG